MVDDKELDERLEEIGEHIKGLRFIIANPDMFDGPARRKQSEGVVEKMNRLLTRVWDSPVNKEQDNGVQ